MDKSAQNELDTLKKKLDKIQAGNRARAKKFQEKVKASDKKMISAIFDAESYDTLCRLRDASVQAGTPESFGNILGKTLSFYVRYNAIANNSKNIIANEPTIKTETIIPSKKVVEVVENLPKAISEPKPIEDPQGSDEIPDCHDKDLTQDERDDILIIVGELYPKGIKGNPKRRADALNKAGVPIKGIFVPGQWKNKNAGDAIRKAKKKTG